MKVLSVQREKGAPWQLVAIGTTSFGLWFAVPLLVGPDYYAVCVEDA